MPLYEYLCSQCGQFEVVQKFSDEALQRCPSCSATVEKLPPRSNFALKGAGWPGKTSAIS